MSDIQPGSFINNRYQILSVLGKGGMATVYKALDRELEAELALKLLNSDQLRVERRKERFLREFVILSGLKHRNIVEVFEQSETESGQPFFVMEILKGLTLADHLRQIYTVNSANLSVMDSILILEQIAGALDYCHRQGVVYCDLKPANILVVDKSADKNQSYDYLKLIDFGISRIISEQDVDRVPNMIGTSYYMSPEQIRSEPLDPGSDIYSFGVLAFEVFTGNVPFNHEALFSITASHLIGKVPSLRNLKRDIPPSIDRMIQICMEKDKAHRYSSMQDIVDRLGKARKQFSRPSFFQRIFGSSL